MHCVMKNGESKCFGFANFATHEDALRGLNATKEELIKFYDNRGVVWKVKAEWAKKNSRGSVNRGRAEDGKKGKGKTVKSAAPPAKVVTSKGKDTSGGTVNHADDGQKGKGPSGKHPNTAKANGYFGDGPLGDPWGNAGSHANTANANPDAESTRQGKGQQGVAADLPTQQVGKQTAADWPHGDGPFGQHASMGSWYNENSYAGAMLRAKGQQG